MGPAALPAPTVVKLGGSLITRKREVEKVRPKVLDRLSEEVAAAEGRPVVLLHGAGSFGHPGARRFGLSRPPSEAGSREERTRGAAVVSAEVRRLHLLVLRALVRAKARPWSIPAAGVVSNREGRLARFDPAPFRWALDQGLLPVSFGDVVPDEVWGTSIASADTLAVELARTLHAGRVVFATDVPGIYTSPARRAKEILAEVTESALAELTVRPGAPDVTGGILAKAEAMRRIAKAGVDAVLISGLSDGALAKAVRGEAVYGSWAHARAG